MSKRNLQPLKMTDTMKRITLLSILLALCSCVAESPFESPGGNLTFEVSLSPVPATRSDDGTTLRVSIPDGGPEEVEAFLRPMPASGTFPDDTLPTRGAPVESMYGSFSFLSDEGLQGTAVAGEDGRFRVGGIQYHSLPKDNGNKFWCWAPSQGDGVSRDGYLLHYRTPSDITRQPDLVVAVTPEMGRLDKGPTPLAFQHALAGLQVRAGTVFPGCTVNSLTLKGVVSEGTYSLRDGVWTPGQTVSDYALLPGSKTGVTPGTGLSEDEWTAMLVPQTLPDDAAISLSLTCNSRQFDFTVPLGGLTLEAGRILTLGIGCRSLFLFEGTASGDFSVWYFKGVASGTAFYKICDVPVSEDGSFSVLVPELTSQIHSYSFGRSAQLLTVTRLPGILASRQYYYRMFQGCTGLKGIYCEIPHGRATSWKCAFYNCSSLTDLPETIHTENVTEFDSMFDNCRKLTTAPIMDTSSGTNFQSMFSGCSSLTALPEYDLGKGVQFSSMFQGCKALTDLPAYQMPRGTNFSGFCKSCTSLRAVPLLGTSAGTNFGGAFSGCTALTDVALIDTGKGTNFQEMFSGCTSLRTIPLLNTSRGTVFRSMFQGCSRLEGIPLLDTSHGTNFYTMFNGCSSLTACPELDTSSGTNFYSMFSQCTGITETWPYDTSKGTNFESMFQGCGNLTRVDALDVSSGTAFGHMFNGCRSLPAVPAFAFTQSSTNPYMFANCKALSAIPDWDWSHMTNCAHMFDGCSALLEITSAINTSSCTNFTDMFLNCTALRRVAALDVQSMLSGSSLFSGCESLVESPELSAPSATAVSQMFDGCRRLSQVRSISFPKGENWYAFFRECRSLETLQNVDCPGVTNLSECFECLYGKGSLTSLQAIPADHAISADNVLSGQFRLVDFGGFTGIGISFDISECTALSKASLLAVLNGLAEVTESRTVTLGAGNLAKLTEEELQIAVDKGWTVR